MKAHCPNKPTLTKMVLLDSETSEEEVADLMDGRDFLDSSARKWRPEGGSGAVVDGARWFRDDSCLGIGEEGESDTTDPTVGGTVGGTAEVRGPEELRPWL